MTAGLRHLAGLALVLLLGSLAPSPARATEAVPYGEGLLWRVERDGVAPSRLLGTMHVTDPRVLDLPAPVAAALDQADSLTVEVVLSPLDTLRVGLAMYLTDGRTLDQIVGAELFDALTAATAPYEMPAGAVRLMRPWGAGLLLSVPPEEFRRAAAGATALDLMLEHRMRDRGRPVHGLETVDEQIAIVDTLPEDQQIALLRQAIATAPKIEVQYAGLVHAYLARNVADFLTESLEQMTGEDRALTERFLETAIYQRNRRMVERMAERLAEGNALVAVGALHLPGERGVLALLAAEGWRITREY